MAPVSKTTKAKKKLADPAAEAHAPPADHDAPTTPAPASSKKESEAKDEAANLVFGVSLDSPHDIEDDANVLAPIAKYAILGMICLMSFAIRLFAVVRYESVCLPLAYL